MIDYRRNFIAGGSFFFTAILAERRLRVLTEHIDEPRNAFSRDAPASSVHNRCAGRAGQGLAVFVIPSHGEAPRRSRGLGRRCLASWRGFWRTAVSDGIAALHPSYELRAKDRRLCQSRRKGKIDDIGRIELLNCYGFNFRTATLFKDTASRSRRMFRASFLPERPALSDQRAQGMPGARCARSRAWCVVNTRVSHHGHTGKRPAS